MNKKPYNQVEEKIKTAAQNWEPIFDEQAWTQMEKLLNETDDLNGHLYGGFGCCL